MTPRDRRGTSGFTLVELLVVIMIMAVLAAISIPYGLNFIRHYQVQGAAQNVAVAMQQARSQAVKRNTRYGVLLNLNYPGPGQYQYTSLDPNPWTSAWDTPIYPIFNPRTFDGINLAYGAVPSPPNNIAHPNAAAGIFSPHGEINDMPQELEFVDGGAFTALLFRSDGSVAAVNPAGPTGIAVLNVNGVNWQLQVRDPRSQLTRTITISRNGRVTVTTP